MNLTQCNVVLLQVCNTANGSPAPVYMSGAVIILPTSVCRLTVFSQLWMSQWTCLPTLLHLTSRDREKTD